MTLNQALLPFNWNLNLSGCLIFWSRSKLTNAIIALHGLSIVIANLYLAMDSLSSYWFSKSLGIFVAWNTVGVAYAAFVILHFWSVRRELEMLLQRLSPRLSPMDLKDVRRLSIWFLVSRISIAILTRFTEYGFILKLIGFSFKTCLLFYDYVHHWDFMALTVFLTFLKVIHTAERNSMTALISRGREATPNTVYDEVRFFIDIKDLVMARISILPFVSFSFLFVQAVSGLYFYHIVSTTQHSLLDTSSAHSSLGRLLIMMAQLTYLTFVTDRLGKESKQNLHSLQSRLFHCKGRSGKWSLVFDEIKQAKQYEYKAWDMFSINKELLLTFCSAFVTFTVLFLQMINQANSIN